jgi:TPP-dependent pyruvate/acetoin dehydrogenase alpha subunit
MENNLGINSSDIKLSAILDEPISIGNRCAQDLVPMLQEMMRIRAVEQKIADMRQQGFIGGPVHLGSGQEAIAVGISKHLRKTDRVFSDHRSHAHILSLGTDLRSLFAEILGRKTGLTKGMGGSMHLWDEPNGFFGSVPIVAGTVPLAVGAGLAAKMQGNTDIAVSYFGDGAIEEGIVHESLNLARMLEIPIIFVCENNLFSSHMHISQRQPSQSVVRFAEANDITHEVVDGNNVIAVEESASRLIKIAREQSQPVFLEAITFRHFGHVDWQKDIDVGVDRSEEDLKLWKFRDPIIRLISVLTQSGFCQESDIEYYRFKIAEEIESSWKIAINDPYPEDSSTLEFVYSEKNL